MWKCITFIIFICITTINTQLISEMACYRLDHNPPDLESEIQRMMTPNTFLNMVEHFTPIEEIVLLRAGEKIVKDENLTSTEFFRLGVFRKSNYFFTVVACFYIYWVFYEYFFFYKSRNEFDRLIMKCRTFISKNLMLLIFASFIILAAYNLSYTLTWVRHYSNAYNNSENRFLEFLDEYNKTVNLISSQFTCYLDEMTTEWDEIESFHRRIRRYYRQNITSVNVILDDVSQIRAFFEEHCDDATSECDSVAVADWNMISDIKSGKITPNFEIFPNWDDYPMEFEAIKQDYSNIMKLDYSEVKNATRDRLMLLKNIYIKIEQLFVMPSSSIIECCFYVLLVLVSIVIFVSICCLIAIFRDHDYLQNNGIANSLSHFLKRFNYFMQATASFALLWSWLVILFSSASHSLYLNVLRDSELEVLGKLNITDSNGTRLFNFRDFLKSTDQSVIEDVINLNTRELLMNNSNLVDHIQEWKTKMNVKLSEKGTFYPPIQEFCENINQIFSENDANWIETGKKKFQKLTKLCKTAKKGCFFCKFKPLIERTVIAAEHIRDKRLSVANRKGDDLEDFHFLHEKYRLQKWNDFVAPLTFLEVPSIITLITLYVMSFMILITISLAEKEKTEEMYESRHEYYKIHTADRGLYWYNT